jgi:hypothetical protein
MTECEEVAENMDATGILTWADAEKRVRDSLGLPQDVGFQVFDNVTEALFNRRNVRI